MAQAIPKNVFGGLFDQFRLITSSNPVTKAQVADIANNLVIEVKLSMTSGAALTEQDLARAAYLEDVVKIAGVLDAEAIGDTIKVCVLDRSGPVTTEALNLLDRVYSQYPSAMLDIWLSQARRPLQG